MPLASSMPAPLLKPLFVAMVTAVGVVGVGALLHRYAAEKTPAPTFVRLQAGLAAAARTIQLDVRPLPEAPRCLCQRADSPLWKDGIPVLGVITFDSDEGPLGAPEAQLDRAGFPQFAFGLAIINNSARALRDLRVTLTFARRDHAGHRVGAVDRGLFWEGVLSPGHAAKWNVSAPGSELRRDIGVTGTLDQTRLAPAPADAFFALTSSRVRAVRLHGATMLAYLRDPRAAVVARRFTLDNARDGAVVARIQRAAADVIPCDLRRSGESLQACIFNASSRVKQALTLREVTPAHDTSGLRSIPIAETIPVHEGIRVRLDLPADGADEWAVVDPTATE